VTYVNTGDDAVGKAVAGGIAAMLKNVGVQIDIRQVPSGDFSKIITGKQLADLGQQPRHRDVALAANRRRR